VGGGRRRGVSETHGARWRWTAAGVVGLEADGDGDLLRGWIEISDRSI
jgi:hypothetical protein